MKIYDEPYTEDLVQWLEQRQLAGRPMPSVKFVDCLFLLNSDDENDHDGYSKPELLLGIYNSLQQICNLDMVGLLVRPVVVMSSMHCRCTIGHFTYLRSRIHQL